MWTRIRKVAGHKKSFCNQKVSFSFVTVRLHIMRRDVFQAIADPTRREILQLVSEQQLNLNAVAENFNISRPAISKHIKILTECGLLIIKKKGRERFCEPQLHKLKEVVAWTEQYSRFWAMKLNNLKSFVESESPKKKKGTGTRPGQQPGRKNIDNQNKKNEYPSN